jgi:hypothetical protein
VSLRDQFEAYRRRAAGAHAREQAEIDRERTDLEARQTIIDETRPQLEARPPGDDACPACFFERAQIGRLRPIPGGAQVDRYRCGTCDYETEIEFR